MCCVWVWVWVWVCVGKCVCGWLDVGVGVGGCSLSAAHRSRVLTHAQSDVSVCVGGWMSGWVWMCG